MTPVAPRGRPIVLEIRPDAVYGTFHEPATGGDTSTAVLICPPWGWDEVTSYRARRVWAERLAAAGRPTLRIDLPGAGDSAGDPLDPGRVDAWLAAIDGSAAWLAAQPGVRRVVVIGLGLGGLLALAAADRGAPIDELILWAMPDSGRVWLRQQRAFGAFQRTGGSDTTAERGGEASASGPPTTDGSGGRMVDPPLEIGGFVLTGETVAALQSLDARTLEPGGIRRALVLDRDGVPAKGPAARLAALRVDVTEAGGSGWGRMVLHPESYFEPVDVFERVDAWLAGPRQPAPSGTLRTPPETADHLILERDGAAIRETSVFIDRPGGPLFGLLAEPLDGVRGGPVAVFLNAGAVRRIGPNRLWVEVARRWAARGVPTLRMDLEGIGDSDGDPGRYGDVNNFYTMSFGVHVEAILDELERRSLGQRSILVGLCAGGYWAFHTAATDPRVTAALILNPRAMIWDSGLLARREARKVEQLLTPGLWRRVASGSVALGRAAPILRAVAVSSGRALLALPGRWRARHTRTVEAGPVETLLDTLRNSGTRVVLAFSGEEPVHDELAADGILAKAGRWPNLVVTTLPGADHTLRPMAAQRAAIGLLDRELDRVLDARD